MGVITGVRVDDSRSLLVIHTPQPTQRTVEKTNSGKRKDAVRSAATVIVGRTGQARAGVTAKKQQQPSRNPKHDIPLTAAAASPESGEECAAPSEEF